MSTVILYASKYGATQKIASIIADKIPNASLIDLKCANSATIENFDTVIIGSAIYAGLIRKEAKDFIEKSQTTLLKKNIALFISGISEDAQELFFKNNFPASLLQHSKANMLLGGIFDPSKTNAIERTIVKLITKNSNYFSSIDDSKITAFIDKLGR